LNLKNITEVTNKFRVLFIEDDKTVQDITYRVLSSFFQTIDVADNAIEALEKFKEKNYNLIITDLAMPKMSGAEMIEKMRQQRDDFYVIVLSAANDPQSAIDSIKAGIDGYLYKPFMFDKFLELLDVIMQKETINSKLENYNENLNTGKHADGNMSFDGMTGFGTLPLLISKIDNIDKFKSPVLILINIDNFSSYNQLYGLECGIEILKKFAVLIKEYNKDKGYELFRINADEFVLLEVVEYLDISKYEEDMKDLFDLAEKSTIEIKDLDLSIDLEITAGISFSSTEPLKKANMALYEARKRGRNFIGFSYEIDYTNELQSNLFWRQEIKNAIYEDRVMAFYQPIVNRQMNVVQYESLIRIKRENNKGETEYLAPEKFLDLSVMTKQYLLLTKFMIETTFKQMSNKNVSISLNLTYQDIKNGEIYRILKENIKKYHLEDRTEFDISNNVIFEILEHEGIDCYNTFLEFINEFKQMGVKIALDDFGTGFSNFSHINSLSPDFIKIDGKLIENITSENKSYELVKAIVKFSKELNIKTIAEHVHSEEVFKAVYDLGVDKFQGFYFGEPKMNIE
jgi:diguanylate cyclase (GGDEF)-like protein